MCSTYHPPDTIDTAPILTMELNSPMTSSAVRPKRAVVQRQQQDEVSAKKPKTTCDESSGVTIVSVESNATDTTNTNPPKESSSSKRTCDTASKNEKSIEVRPPQSNDESGYVSCQSPILHSAASSTRQDQLTQEFIQQRVSLSPIIHAIKYDEPPIPVFHGSDKEKLYSCLGALKPDHRSNIPTICFSNENNLKKSKFASNIGKVSNFVHGVLLSRGRNGDGHKTLEASAALYVCGSPGLGKTSGVDWCCNTIAKLSSSSDVTMKICHVNAAYLTSQSTPLTMVIKEIAKCMELKSQQPHENTITKYLRNKSDVIMIVIDEIDAFVTGSGRSTGGTDCLRKLLQWANNPRMQMGLIGISNCMNDDNMSEIGELGKVRCYIVRTNRSQVLLGLLTLFPFSSSSRKL
jgi:AAA domain